MPVGGFEACPRNYNGMCVCTHSIETGSVYDSDDGTTLRLPHATPPIAGRIQRAVLTSKEVENGATEVANPLKSLNNQTV